MSHILDRILESPDLPSMPLVALRVVELTQQENVSVGEIAGVIRSDPALTAKLLHTANSPLFGLPRTVSSLDQATMILGLRTVKVMALSFSLVGTMQAAQAGGFDYPRYWRRSLTTAVASKLLAEAQGDLRKEECFVGGLLADIGMLAARQCVPDQYSRVLGQLDEESRPVQDVEAAELGLTHAQITTELLRRWSLPEMLCDAIAAHHGEGLDALPERTRMIASTINAASLIAELFCGDVDSSTLDEVKAECLTLVPITAGALDGILDDLHANVSEMASLFQVDIGAGVSHDMLRTQAMTQLATISISAEMERMQAASRVDEVQRSLEEAQRRATTDGLTQIPNRQAFDEHLATVMAHASGSGGTVGLILLDLDHFKSLNDTYGHQAGDEALRRVGQCLRDTCRSPALPARYGGEEFAVVASDTTPRALQTLAELIRGEIEKIEFLHERQPIRFTASLGAALIDLGSSQTTSAQLIERADTCLYKAKRDGRNRVKLST